MNDKRKVMSDQLSWTYYEKASAVYEAYQLHTQHYHMRNTTASRGVQICTASVTLNWIKTDWRVNGPVQFTAAVPHSKRATMNHIDLLSNKKGTHTQS